MKNIFLGFWGEQIKNLKLIDQGDIIVASGMGECPKALIEAKSDTLPDINLSQMIAVPVSFDVSKKTNKKNGQYRIYTPEAVINGFKIPQEFEDRYSPLVFECTYQEDKLKGAPRFYDREGKSYPVVLEKTFQKPPFVKRLTQKVKD